MHLKTSAILSRPQCIKIDQTITAAILLNLKTRPNLDLSVYTARTMGNSSGTWRIMNVYFQTMSYLSTSAFLFQNNTICCMTKIGNDIITRPRSGQLHVPISSCMESEPLRWRHNGRDGVSNHQPHHCLLNHLFRRRSKKTSKIRVTGLCTGNSPVTGEFPAQKANDTKNVSIWWRHRNGHHCVWICSSI